MGTGAEVVLVVVGAKVAFVSDCDRSEYMAAAVTAAPAPAPAAANIAIVVLDILNKRRLPPGVDQDEAYLWDER